MAPRQPLKLNKTGKPASRGGVRKPAAKPVALPVALPPTPASAALPRPAAKTAVPRGAGGFSLYPDLTMAIAMLEKRRRQLTQADADAPEGGLPTPASQQELIDKWLVSLKKVQSEITRLRQLEKLSSALRTPLSDPVG